MTDDDAKCRDCSRHLQPADEGDPEGPWLDDDGDRTCDVTGNDHYLFDPAAPAVDNFMDGLDPLRHAVHMLGDIDEGSEEQRRHLISVVAPIVEQLVNSVPRGITLTRDQLEAWAGRRLTDEHLDRLDEAIPHSSIPDAINVICDQFAPLPDDEESMQTFTVEVLRMVAVNVTVEALSAEDAADAVKQREVPLPTVTGGTVLDGCEYVVYGSDDDGNELYREED